MIGWRFNAVAESDRQARHIGGQADIVSTSVSCAMLTSDNKNSSGDEIANVNFFYNIAHVEASAYAH